MKKHQVYDTELITGANHIAKIKRVFGAGSILL